MVRVHGELAAQQTMAFCVLIPHTVLIPLVAILADPTDRRRDAGDQLVLVG